MVLTGNMSICPVPRALDSFLSQVPMWAAAFGALESAPPVGSDAAEQRSLIRQLAGFPSQRLQFIHPTLEPFHEWKLGPATVQVLTDSGRLAVDVTGEVVG